MHPPRRRALVLAGLAACACGGAAPGRHGPGNEDGGSTPAVVHSCTGPIPADATMCPGADADLAEDAPRVLVGPFGSCGDVKCSYACDATRWFTNGACATLPAPPEHHFLDNGDGTVTDDAWGRTWLRDVGCADSVDGVARSAGATWWEAGELAARLASGSCGLQDGSGPGDWRLPVDGELMTLWSLYGSDANPFTDARGGGYWSATAHSATATAVDPGAQTIDQFPKESLFHVWPCR
jgi:Protein of unknown function (DUF1566)